VQEDFLLFSELLMLLRSFQRPGFSSGFPVEFGGFGELHAPFFTERRTRGSLQCIEAGNPGSGNG